MTACCTESDLIFFEAASTTTHSVVVDKYLSKVSTHVVKCCSTNDLASATSRVNCLKQIPGMAGEHS